MQWPMMLVLAVFTGTIQKGTCQQRTPTSQTTFPTPPIENPVETGRPRNMRNCRINADTALPWIVGILDKQLTHGFVGLGSMITYIAFVTTCRSFLPSQKQSFRAVAQFIWNTSIPDEPCMQENFISDIYRHPKCAKSQLDATFFDFSVMRMTKPFSITGTAYPTLRLPTTPLHLLTIIRYINVIPHTVGCVLPYFRNRIELPPVFDFNTYVVSIPFYSKCIKLLCQRNPASEDFSRMCQRRFADRANATMLCMKNKYQYFMNILLYNNDRYWYTGTPLVCNGTAVAMAAQPKIRHNFNANKDDIHFLVTFLRVWPWLFEHIKNHSVPWVMPFYIEDMELQPVVIHGDATVSSPSSLFVITIVLNYLLRIRAQLHLF